MSSRDVLSSRRSTAAAPKEKKDTTGNLPGEFVGWISKRWQVAWVVSPHRADKRTGWVNHLEGETP